MQTILRTPPEIKEIFEGKSNLRALNERNISYYEFCPNNGLRYEFIVVPLPGPGDLDVETGAKGIVSALGAGHDACLVTYVRRGFTWPSYPMANGPWVPRGEEAVLVCHESYVREKLFGEEKGNGDEVHVVTAFLNALFRCYSTRYAVENFEKIRRDDYRLTP